MCGGLCHLDKQMLDTDQQVHFLDLIPPTYTLKKLRNGGIVPKMKYFFVYVHCLNSISGNPLAHLTSRPIHTYYGPGKLALGPNVQLLVLLVHVARVALKSLHKAFRTILDWALIIRNVCSYCLLLLLLPPRAWPVCDVYTFWRLNKSCEWPT